MLFPLSCYSLPWAFCSVSSRPWGCDHLCLGFLSQVCSLHMHPPTSFYTHVCTCICPILGRIFKPWDLGCQGFQDSILPLGIKNLGCSQLP